MLQAITETNETVPICPQPFIPSIKHLSRSHSFTLIPCLIKMWLVGGLSSFLNQAQHPFQQHNIRSWHGMCSCTQPNPHLPRCYVCCCASCHVEWRRIISAVSLWGITAVPTYPLPTLSTVAPQGSPRHTATPAIEVDFRMQGVAVIIMVHISERGNDLTPL